MATRKTFTIKCIITGKDETYEITVIKTRPSGKGGQVYEFPQKPSCLNLQCSFREKADCPLSTLTK